MLSRQILQRTINEMKEIVAAEISLWNAEGMIAVKTSGADESAKEQVKIYPFQMERADGGRRGRTLRGG